MTNTDTTASPVQKAGMGLMDYVVVARTYWKGITAVALVGVIAAFAWASVQPKIYASESTGIVITGGGDNLSLSLAGDNLAKSKTKNYVSVAGSRLIGDRVKSDLGLTASVDALLGSISVQAPVDTAEIRVTAKSESPAAAQQLADAWVSALAAQVAELETTGVTDAGGLPVEASVRVVPLGKAPLPESPVSPNVRLALAIGALCGLILGASYALVRNHLDRRLRTVADVEALVNIPVIGTLPVDHRLDSGSSVLELNTANGAAAGSEHSHAISEALRELRTNLQFIDVDNPPRVLVVTSSVPSEGKSTVTANLAVTMAAAGENVVVVDGDLRRPTVVKVFQLVPGVGVTDVLSGNAAVSDVIQQWGAMPNLHVLGSGRVPPNPSELLGSRSMQKLISDLSKDAIVLIDAPPLLPVTDAAVLSRVADGVIVVVRSGKTTQDELARSVANLKKAKSNIFGAILNCVPVTGANSYSYYGAYRSNVSDAPEPVSAPELSEFDRIIASSSEPATAEPTDYSPVARRRSR